jgi:hypothetical protein
MAVKLSVEGIRDCSEKVAGACLSNQQKLNHGSEGGSPTVPRSIGSLMMVR